MNLATQEALRVLQNAHNAGKDHINYTFLQEIYKRHGKYDPVSCMKEIRLDGSNTFANVFRGGVGVEYDEIVKDVAKVIGVKGDEVSGKSCPEIESLILAQMVKKYWDSLSEEEKRDELKRINALSNIAVREEIMKLYKGGAAVMYGVVAKIGTRAAEKIVVKTILKYLSKMVAKQAAKQAARAAVAFVPILNIVMSASIVMDFASPANRKIIPTVINIALMRMRENTDE